MKRRSPRPQFGTLGASEFPSQKENSVTTEVLTDATDEITMTTEILTEENIM